MPRLVLISDTHNQHRQLTLPDGDVLIHCGDFTGTGTARQVEDFVDWFVARPHPHKVLIAGNHDVTLHASFYERHWRRFHRAREDAAAIRARLDAHARAGALHYLLDREVTAAGLRIYGAPWQPEFCGWAFNLPRGAESARVWAAVPAGLDVLVTHGPPLGALDRVSNGERVGCADLAREVFGRARPRVHAFGHIHESHGALDVQGVRCVNASSCDLSYAPTQAPLVVDL